MRTKSDRTSVGRSWLFLAVLWGLGAGLAPGLARDVEVGDAETEKKFILRSRQLTFEGLRAGEGYFSADGKRLVFQSEREKGNPFYQIYELNLETGETERLSNGVGKTTCAFYRGRTDDVLFASTHHDPRSRELQKAELDFRASGKERRYSWDYDPEMEIFATDREGGGYLRLTDARGYDAEASYSPDGAWIVFASNREAYRRKLSDTEKSQLETDPAVFADLYIMRADGTEVRRLTDTIGYDGGPFFTVDGRRVVWRRFDESGLIADVWTVNVDGTDPLQITDFGSMSWAPYPHPSGLYFFFTSNKLGFENFELFIVDSRGLKEPVRVTYTPGFDGLPVPSPDGERLIWTSNRHGKKGAQLFMGNWNHQGALAALQQAPLRNTVHEEKQEEPEP